MIYVIAGNFSQFRQFEWEYRSTHPYPDTLRYVRDCHDLRGITPHAQFVVWGTWYERKDVQEIHDVIHYILGLQQTNWINNQSMEKNKVW